MRSLLSLAAVLVLASGAGAAVIPLFSENFEGGVFVVGSAPADTTFLDLNNDNGRIQTGLDGNASKYYSYNTDANMDVAILSAPSTSDFNLYFDWANGSDVWGSDFEIGGDGDPSSSDFVHIGLSPTQLVAAYSGAGNSPADTVAIPAVTAYSQWVSMHVLRQGSSLKINAWDAGTTEPTGWMMDLVIPAGVGDGTGNLNWRWHNVNLDNIVSAPVPEPASMTLLALGALALIRRRRA